jgi:hypothetical protein
LRVFWQSNTIAPACLSRVVRQHESLSTFAGSCLPSIRMSAEWERVAQPCISVLGDVPAYCRQRPHASISGGRDYRSLYAGRGGRFHDGTIRPVGNSEAFSRRARRAKRSRCFRRGGMDSRRKNCRTRRCSESEPADSAGDKSNIRGGWLRSLTYALGQHNMTLLL